VKFEIISGLSLGRSRKPSFSSIGFGQAVLKVKYLVPLGFGYFCWVSFKKVRIGYRIYWKVRLYFQEFSCTLQNSDIFKKPIKL